MRFALAGNPNSGKTTLFNALTGSTAHVGNWPGVTVDRKEGKYKRLPEPIDIIDLPGIYSLSPYSPEEVVARNYILEEKPDLIINIIDVTNLERNLYLTTQLLETDYPVIVVLNMMDALKKDGVTIDIKTLEKELGAPVSAISALKGRGIDELMKTAYQTCSIKRRGKSVLEHSGFGEQFLEIQAKFEARRINNPCFRAAKYLEGEKIINDCNLDTEISAIKEKIKLNPIFEGDFESAIADIRYKYIVNNYKKAVLGSKKHGDINRSNKIDKVLTNKWLGIPIFLFIMFTCFHLTFSENLFFITDLPSPGAFLVGLLEHGIHWATDAMSAFLIRSGAPQDGWVYGLIINGLFAGVGSVLGFLPLILILFLFLSIMEDSGYMARAAFLMDRLMRCFGLSGKAFLPLLMGFGCSVPAIAATKTLENENEKRMTIMMMTGFSCGAKLPIWTVFAAAFFPKNADIMVFGIYVAGIVFACLSGVVLKMTVFKSESTAFIMELPTYHLPQARNLFLNIWEKCKDYVTRATTIIAGSTIVIWFLSNFNPAMQMVEANSRESILGILGNILRPLFIPLGFVSDAGNGWRAVVAILTGLIAKEMVVATMGVLYTGADALQDNNAKMALISQLSDVFTPMAAISFMLFNLLSIPCMAAVATAHAELRSRKWTFMVICFWFVMAYAVSVLVFRIGTFLGF